jgi:hypothetical protein
MLPGTILDQMSFNYMSTEPHIAALWQCKSKNTRLSNPNQHPKSESDPAKDDELWLIEAGHLSAQWLSSTVIRHRRIMNDQSRMAWLDESR